MSDRLYWRICCRPSSGTCTATLMYWPGRKSASGRPSEGASTKEVITSDRKSTRLNSSHVKISYAVFCLKKKKNRVVRGRDTLAEQGTACCQRQKVRCCSA